MQGDMSTMVNYIVYYVKGISLLKNNTQFHFVVRLSLDTSPHTTCMFHAAPAAVLWVYYIYHVCTYITVN